jgi:hypothetical protein
VRLRCTANGKVSERKQDIGIRIKPIIFARFGYRDQRILIDDSDHSSRSGVGDLRAPIRAPVHIECRVLAQSGSPFDNATFTERHVIECQSFRLDISRPNHLRPLLGFAGDQLAEVGRRARQCIGSLYWIVRGALTSNKAA